MRMAGTEGFEPTDDGIKTRCLTTWLRPNEKLSKNLGENLKERRLSNKQIFKSTKDLLKLQ